MFPAPTRSSSSSSRSPPSPTSPGGGPCPGARRWPASGPSCRTGLPALLPRRRSSPGGYARARASKSRASLLTTSRTRRSWTPALCSPRSWTSSGATRSTRTPLRSRVFSDRHPGRAAGKLLDDEIVRVVRHDPLVLQLLVAPHYEEPLRVRADLLVGGQRHANLRGARARRALAHELCLLADQTEALAELAQPLVHFAEERLVPAIRLPRSSTELDYRYKKGGGIDEERAR